MNRPHARLARRIVPLVALALLSIGATPREAPQERHAGVGACASVRVNHWQVQRCAWVGIP